MVVTVADVKELLPAYKGLSDTQIEKSIENAEAYLDGINPDWVNLAKADTILTFAAASITLQLHFPQNVNAYTALDNKVMEMLQSMWNSANMYKKKGRFVRIVNPVDE